MCEFLLDIQKYQVVIKKELENEHYPYHVQEMAINVTKHVLLALRDTVSDDSHKDSLQDSIGFVRGLE